MQRDPRAYLSDILEAAAVIQDATSEMDVADHIPSRLFRSAVEREFIIIGEALKLLAQRGLPRSKMDDKSSSSAPC